MQYRIERYATYEHFHWSRFERMHRHSYLDIDKLTSIVIFKDADLQNAMVDTVLALNLSRELEYSISGNYSISQPEFDVDDWQYQLVIHRDFDNEGIPEKWSDEVLALTPNENTDLKIFPLQSGEYCAHCGLWYTEGDTAYVEPVVTVPQHKGKGLAKAVVYEACNQARKLGAKRATVLSNQEFYHWIDFECSSEVYCWEVVSNDL